MKNLGSAQKQTREEKMNTRAPGFGLAVNQQSPFAIKSIKNSSVRKVFYYLSSAVFFTPTLEGIAQDLAKERAKGRTNEQKKIGRKTVFCLFMLFMKDGGVNFQ